MDFLPDIEQFIRLHFRTEKHAAVTRLLQRPVITSPRVMRGVLFLSNGSITMLEHYISKAEQDLPSTMEEAEYSNEISETPVFVRDMSLPFYQSQPLGPKACEKTSVPISESGDEVLDRNHHRRLTGRGFVLGRAEYSILADQPHKALVHCERRLGEVVHRVRLPLVFVLEQFAETVDMTQSGFTAS